MKKQNKTKKEKKNKKGKYQTNKQTNKQKKKQIYLYASKTLNIYIWYIFNLSWAMNISFYLIIT